MKRILAVSALLALCVVVSFGQPTTGSSQSSATKGEPVRAIAKAAPAAVPNTANIELTPFVGTAFASPDWGAMADGLIKDMLGNGINRVPHALVLPTDYSVVKDGKVPWYSFMYSMSTPLWLDMLNPSYPFNEEMGTTVQQVVKATALSGDSISLAMLNLLSASSDENGILSDGIVFKNGDFYTSRAVGIKADGTKITSGAADQMCHEIVFVAQMKLFNGGGTLPGQHDIYNYVSPRNMSVTYTARVLGDPNSETSATVSLTGTPPAQPPHLNIANNGDGSVSIGVTDADQSHSYQIQASPSPLGPWGQMAVVSGGRTVLIPVTEHPAQFYRAVVQ